MTRKKTPNILGELLSRAPGVSEAEDAAAGEATDSPAQKTPAQRAERRSAAEPKPTETTPAVMASEAKPSPDRKKEETASSQKKALLAASQAEQPEARLVEPEQRLDAVPAEPVGPGGNAPARFVSFRLDQRLYALPLDHVERALRMVAVTPVPEAPAWVAGVIDLQGRVIPVVDLRQRFEQTTRDVRAEDRLLIVQVQERAMALMVDEVTEVLAVPSPQVEASAGLVPDSRPLKAVIRRDEDLILVLDTAQLFPTEGGTIGQ